MLPHCTLKARCHTSHKWTLVTQVLCNESLDVTGVTLSFEGAVCVVT